MKYTTQFVFKITTLSRWGKLGNALECDFFVLKSWLEHGKLETIETIGGIIS